MIRPWISKGSISTEKEPTPLPYNGATAVAFAMLISYLNQERIKWHY